MVRLEVDIDDKAFIDKLNHCINANPNILNNVLQKAMKQFDTISRDAALSGGAGLRRVTGKVYQAGFKRYVKTAKKYTSAIFTSRIANIFQGQKKGSNLPTIKIMKIAEKAFRNSGILHKLLQDEIERHYNG